MNQAEWGKIQEYFDLAVDGSWEELAKKPAWQRENPSIKKEVEDLFRSHQKSSAAKTKPFFEAGSAAESSTLEELAPETDLDGFTILRKIGEGGLAKVYLARQAELMRLVAIKVSAKPGKEGALLAKLDHPNIVRVYSQQPLPWGADGNFIAMQYIDGPTLLEIETSLQDQTDPSKPRDLFCQPSNQILSASQIEWSDYKYFKDCSYADLVCRIGSRLAAALSYAHDNDVLHLDIKPGNILFNGLGQPFLVDFNISMDADEAAKEGVLGGTERYMSPEVLARIKDPEQNQPIDQRADIYSLGRVLIELLDLDDKPVPETLHSIVSLACHPDPSKRIQSAAELEYSLSQLERNNHLSDTFEKELPGVFRKTGFGWWLLGMALIPQLIGSIFNISYNTFVIAAEMTDVQKSIFLELIPIYNLIFYPLGIAVFTPPVIKLVRSIKKLQFHETEDIAIKSRSICKKLPARLLLATTAGWLPGALFFPALISYQTHTFSGAVYQHFFFSFFVSWLMACSYALLFTQWTLWTRVWPRVWHFSESPKLPHSRWVGWGNKSVLSLQYLTGIVPLSAAGFLLISRNLQGDLHNSFGYLGLVLGLMLIAAIGFVISVPIADWVRRAQHHFRNHEDASIRLKAVRQ